MEEPSYKTEDHVEFTRRENGDVLLTISDAFGNPNLHFDIPVNIWASLVLTMSKFSERPNDWHEWMAHHNGVRDVLAGDKNETVLRAALTRAAGAFSDLAGEPGSREFNVGCATEARAIRDVLYAIAPNKAGGDAGVTCPAEA